MIFDAIILSGGRSARLDGVPKAEFKIGSKSLLNIAVDAVAAARQTVIVGDGVGVNLAFNMFVTREHPLFSGPAAAIAAGLSELKRNTALAPFVVVIACDMPGVHLAVESLLSAAETIGTADGLLARDASGQEQYLVSLFRSESLGAAVTLNKARLVDLSARALLASLTLMPVAVSADSTDDVDTWDDAQRLGAMPPSIKGI
jgi:molybdopterin-guanine dinucleotide biosynthesis protein A